MTSVVGHRQAAAALLGSLSAGHLHHAWLLVGPSGIGKATFARAVAARLLAEAEAPERLPPTLDLPPGTRAGQLMEAGSHPDFRELRRLPKKDGKDGELARSITVDQVRALAPFLGTAGSLSQRRVVLIDSADELERPSASNALLKSLEEPPAGVIFLLVSHAPGRLLPTIRSRCRTLRLEPLGEPDMIAVLGEQLPDLDADARTTLIRNAEGSPGRALRYAEMDLASIDAALRQIVRDGDGNTAVRSRLARSLAPKAAQPRYEAFLDRVPGIIAEAAHHRVGGDLKAAFDAYDEARNVAAAARGLSLDPAGTVFELAGIVARLAAPR